MPDDNPRATIGLTGLATMGRNLARNIARNGHTIAVHNRTTARTTALLDEFGDEGDFVGNRVAGGLRCRHRAPARDHRDGQGRRGHRRRDRRARAPARRGRHRRRRRKRPLRGHPAAPGEAVRGRACTSWAWASRAARRARSTVPRSWSEAPTTPSSACGPVVESIAAAVDGTPCCAHVGPDGAGHFVKMVHNGIEYADMQLIAESYDLLRTVLGLEPAEVADVFEQWNGGDLESFLIEMTADVLRHVDHDTGSRSSTSWSTRPSRRAPGAGPCRTRWSSACR